MSGSRFAVCFSTAPDPRTARRLARVLVDERLVACVSLLPNVRSVYRWKGRRCEESETILWMKTRAARLRALKARLREIHPYEVPEFVVLSIRAGLPAYLSWVAKQTQEAAKKRR